MGPYKYSLPEGGCKLLYSELKWEIGRVLTKLSAAQFGAIISTPSPHCLRVAQHYDEWEARQFLGGKIARRHYCPELTVRDKKRYQLITL